MKLMVIEMETRVKSQTVMAISHTGKPNDGLSETLGGPCAYMVHLMFHFIEGKLSSWIGRRSRRDKGKTKGR